MELSISPIQVIGIFVSSLALAKVIADYRRHLESRTMFIFWLFVWLTVAGVVIYPGFTIYIKDWLLGPNQSIGTIIGSGMIFLLFIVYRIYIKAERIERILKNHASDLALKDFIRDLRKKKK